MSNRRKGKGSTNLKLKHARATIAQERVTIKRLRAELADEQDQMAKYLGSVTDFGQCTLKALAQVDVRGIHQNAGGQLVDLMFEAAVKRGLMEFHEPSKRFRIL